MDPASERICDMESNLHRLRIEISALKATIAHMATKAELAELRGQLMVELVERDPSSFARLWKSLGRMS